MNSLWPDSDLKNRPFWPVSVCVGLALWSLSELITRGVSSLTLSTILLILAFIAFVLGAIGWGYKKIGLIAVGLALWVGSIVLPMIIH